MERSEPTFVPEWLKTSRSLTGGVCTSHSSDHTTSKLATSRSFMNDNVHDPGRSLSSDRTNSSYFRQSFSSNGSGKLRSYNSFGRNQHDRDLVKDNHDSHSKEKFIFGDHRNLEVSDPLKNTLSSKFEKDSLRRSQSMISGKHVDTWHKRVVTDLSSSSGNNNIGLLARGGSAAIEKKTIFEREFPSLGAEERSVGPEVGRIPSPGLNRAIQSFSFGTSAALGGEKWTSALAEVPLSVGSNGTVFSVQQASQTPSTVGLGTSIGLNMAEAVVQGPNHSQNTSQLPTGSQKLEELAIKQSRQLIPVTPSLPKIFVSMSDKQKMKAGPQPYPVTSSLQVSNSPRGGPVKGDVSKAASNMGKLHVLKPVRERKGTPAVKENLSPTSSVRATSSFLSASLPISASPATRSPPTNPAFPITELKPAMPMVEKPPTSQAQSRKDFFNLMRKKSVTNSSSDSGSSTANSSSLLDTSPAPSPSLDMLAETDVVTAPSTPMASDTPLSVNHEDELTGDDDSYVCQKYNSNENKHLCPDPVIPEAEEAAFLRSLGWEENSDEGGLTEEEISAFYKDVTKYINSKPSLNLS